MIVQDAMTDYFASAHIRSTIGDAMEKMLAEGLDTLLIVDDCSKLVGSIHEPILMDVVFNPGLLQDSVNSHMERHFVTVAPEEPLDLVVEKFAMHKASELPVISSGKLVGVLTRRQLLRAIVGRKEFKLLRQASVA